MGTLSILRQSIKPFLILSLLLAWVWISPNLAKAQKPKANTGFEIYPSDNTEFEIRGNQRINIQTGFPVAIYALNYPVMAGLSPVDQTKQFLMAYSGALGLEKNDLSDLVLKTMREGPAGNVIRFNQVQRGIQVYDAEVTVNIDRGNRVQFVMCSYKHNLSQEPKTEIISAVVAREIAIDYLNLSGTIVLDKISKVIVQLEGITHLCHRLQLQGQEPTGEWEVLVDAETGTLLKVTDNALYCHGEKVLGDNDECEPLLPMPPAMVNGTGNVFDADPLSSATATYGGSYVDGSDANTAVLTAQLQSRTLNQIDLTGGIHRLLGPYATIIDFEAPSLGLFTQASSVFAFDRNANNFEAVNTYYFIDKSMRYLNTTIGVTVMPYQYAGGVQCDRSGLNGADNSHYIGGSGRLAFGEGGVDDAEDSDVILHELGHGLHDWITSGGLSNNQGLSEGTGDYWAMSYSRSLNQWILAQPGYHYVFSWDGHNPFWGGRTTNYGAVYPGGLTGAIHTDGQIWSTCMMKIYDAIGRTSTDRVLWEGLNLTNGSSNQNDAAVAVQQAAINMGYSSAQLNSIRTILQGCGYTLPALPLALQTNYFDAERLNKEVVLLTWTTEIACNVDEYSIERRTGNENDFKSVGNLRGSTNCATENFSFEDLNSGELTSWYRIQERGSDGLYYYTQVRAVPGTANSETGITVYPQPVESNLNFWIHHETIPGQEINIRVLNTKGEVILNLNKFISGSSPQIEVEEAANLAPGFYLLEVRIEEEKFISRFTRVQ